MCISRKKANNKKVKTIYQLSFFKLGKNQVTIKWITKKVKSLFSLKDKNSCPACQIYKGTFVCDETYIGETIRNSEIRWNEHEDIHKESEPAKNLRKNPKCKFKWETVLQPAKSYRQRKNLEASFIAITGATLNNQLDTKTFIYSVMVLHENFQLIVNCINVFQPFIDFLSLNCFPVCLCNYHSFN